MGVVGSNSRSPGLFLARLFFKEKKSRYCHDPGVVVGGVVVVGVVVGVGVGVKNFNLGHNFFITEAISMKLHTLVNHHKGYNLTKGQYYARLLDRIILLYGLGKYHAECNGKRERFNISLNLMEIENGLISASKQWKLRVA